MSLLDRNLPGPFYGAIDLGTNTCRLIIGKPLPQEDEGSFEVINSFTRIIRFGEHLEMTRNLSQGAMERALNALDECAKRLRFYEVSHLRCVATAACRQAENAQDFLQKVYQKTGLRLEIISAHEESELAVSGCVDLFDPTFPYGIVFDIGGGSTEVVVVALLPDSNFQVLDSLSLPYGILSLRDPICSPKEKKDISMLISNQIQHFALRNNLFQLINDQKIQMIGASGTVTTLAAIILKLEKYDRKLVHEVVLYRKDLEAVIKKTWGMSREQRFNHPCIGPQRLDFLMGGIAIFQGIYKVLNLESLIVADRGVREGILRNLLKAHAAASIKSWENSQESPSAA